MMRGQPRVFGETPPPGALLERRNSAYAVFQHNGRIALTIDRMATDIHNLDLPGGGLKENETRKEAMIREVREETGWIVKPKSLLLEYAETYERSLGESYRENHACVYLADPIRLGLNEEDDHEVIYLDPSVAIANLRHASHRAAIVEWLSTNSKYKLNLAKEYEKAKAINPRH